MVLEGRVRAMLSTLTLWVVKGFGWLLGLAVAGVSTALIGAIVYLFVMTTANLHEEPWQRGRFRLWPMGEK